MDTTLLTEIGLTDGEIKVYLALLELGETTIMPLSRASHVTASKVYPILDRLLEKGLITTIIKRNIKHFSPTNPKKIKEYLQERIEALQDQQQDLNRLLPELERRLNEHKEPVSAEVFVGWRGLKAAYDEMIDELRPGDHDYVIGASKGSDPTTTARFFGKKMREAKEKGILISAIFQMDSLDYYDAAQGSYNNVADRWLALSSPTEVNFYKSTVMLVILTKTPLLIRVRSQELVDGYHDYFKLLWKIAKEDPRKRRRDGSQ